MVTDYTAKYTETEISDWNMWKYVESKIQLSFVQFVNDEAHMTCIQSNVCWTGLTVLSDGESNTAHFHY